MFSSAILRIPALAALLGAQPVAMRALRRPRVDAIVGWGQRPSTHKARAHAKRHGLPFRALEDGFLRSFGTGERYPRLSLMLDEQGIYYDCTRPSALEALLASPRDLLAGLHDDVARARALIVRERLSKYNHAPDLPAGLLRAGDRGRVLVVDQTEGDMSVRLGGADAASFQAMLAAARAENPQATVYVKTHPEVSAGAKRGYLTAVADDERTVVLRQAVNPLSLVEQMDRVYVVSSTLGFEALLLGKPVACFGLPWYAGWGATDDRLRAHPALARRAARRRSVDELFAAAYLHATRWLDPRTHQRGTIFDVIDWLALQRRMDRRWPGRMIGVGLRRWKAANLRPLLSVDVQRVHFVSDAQAAGQLQPGAGDALLFWGREAPAGLAELAARSGARLVRVEDGFVRSVGLGSDMIAPRSLVLDDVGLYFDATRPSALERLLGEHDWSADELRRARAVRDFIVRHGISKYNLERREPARWRTGGRPVVLVPGQVEDDASIRFGCTGVRTNLALLQAARRLHPDAFIVYKPHPDVASGNRHGRLALADARGLTDHVETRLSIVSCIEACDVLHTMSSLSGFDALLRGKRVVTWGQPFYAGWGLTEDRASDAPALARRTRRLTLDELVAGTLLLYPIYYDPELRGYTTCEAVLQHVLDERTRREQDGTLGRLSRGWLARNRRKLAALWRGWRQ